MEMKVWKNDAEKVDPTLVPPAIVWCIAKVREFGVKKYSERDSWKRVETQRYRAALYRHFLEYLENPDSADEESGLPHLWHMACNIAFLCELEKGCKNE